MHQEIVSALTEYVKYGVFPSTGYLSCFVESTNTNKLFFYDMLEGRTIMTIDTSEEPTLRCVVSIVPTSLLYEIKRMAQREGLVFREYQRRLAAPENANGVVIASPPRLRHPVEKTDLELLKEVVSINTSNMHEPADYTVVRNNASRWAQEWFSELPF